MCSIGREKTGEKWPSPGRNVVEAAARDRSVLDN